MYFISSTPVKAVQNQVKCVLMANGSQDGEESGHMTVNWRITLPLLIKMEENQFKLRLFGFRPCDSQSRWQRMRRECTTICTLYIQIFRVYLRIMHYLSSRMEKENEMFGFRKKQVSRFYFLKLLKLTLLKNLNIRPAGNLSHPKLSYDDVMTSHMI